MKSTNLFKALLLIQTIGVLTYTLFVFQNKGGNLFEVYLNDIKNLTWNGQFNLDFSAYLLLSGLWIVWRNKFTKQSFLLALVATVIGIIVFAPYLLLLLIKEKGSVKKLLIGDR